MSTRFVSNGQMPNVQVKRHLESITEPQYAVSSEWLIDNEKN